MREEGRRRAHPGLIVLMDAPRGPPWSQRPAEPCSPNAAGSCANSVAANTRSRTPAAGRYDTDYTRRDRANAHEEFTPTYFKNMTVSGAGYIAEGGAMDDVGSHRHGPFGEHTHGDPSFTDGKVGLLRGRGCHIDRFHGLAYDAGGGLLPRLIVGNMLQIARRECLLEPPSPEQGDSAVVGAYDDFGADPHPAGKSADSQLDSAATLGAR